MNLMWFRNDLRVDDNPALFQATADPETPTIAVYLYCNEQWEMHGVGKNQQALINQAIKNLRYSLNQLNISLLILDSQCFKSVPATLKKLTRLLGIEKVFFNMQYPVNERARDKAVVELLQPDVECLRFAGDSLLEPWKVVNGQGEGYKVFSAFARNLYQQLEQSPLLVCDTPKVQSEGYSINNILERIQSLSVMSDLPEISITADKLPEISEKAAQKQLQQFCHERIQDYDKQRDFPEISGTSGLSSALAVGSISAKYCFVHAKNSTDFVSPDAVKKWLNELVWRDFYRAVMWHFPHVCKNQAFLAVDNQIQWSQNQLLLKQWESGETGIPIVDAAMKQLVTTGWMHNRLRMVVASYLSKNLWLDWRLGESFFAQHLFDYDFASNNGGWQWSASVGTDAVPYFRVFNPQSQQKRFDPEARFIKKWIPQLSRKEGKLIHQFETKPLDGYPQPQVDLKASRQLAIEAFKQAKAIDSAS